MLTDSNSAVVAEYEQNLINKGTVCAVAVLVVYEHLITLKYEIDLLWRRKWSAATWIFVFNRYLLLSTVLFLIVPVGPQICATAWVINLLQFLTYDTLPNLLLHAFTILRGFALLQDHSWRLSVTWILVALALGLAVCDAYDDFTGSWEYIDDPVLGPSCYSTGFYVSFAIIKRLATASTVFGIASAAIVLIVTIRTTARQVLRTSSLGMKSALSQILLRDGSLFFLLILLNDILALITNDTGPINVILNVLAVLLSILLSRFIINLRQANTLATIPSDNQRLSRFSIPNFRMPTLDDVVGNLGEPLDFVEYRLDDNDDGEQDTAAQDGETGPDAAHQDIENAFESTLADAEAAGPSGSGSGSAGAVVVGHRMDFEDFEPELRLSPTLTA